MAKPSTKKNPEKPAAAVVVTTPQIFRDYLTAETFQGTLTKIVSKSVSADRLVTLAVQALTRQPELQECSKISLSLGVLEAAEVGLEIGSGVMANAFLVPFWNERANEKQAKLIVSYRGLAELARRSGLVQRIEARAIHRNDKIVVRAGTDPKITHRWSVFEDRGPIVGYYAVAFFKDGSTQFDQMTDAEVELVRIRAKSGDSDAWKFWRPEMGKKTVVRRLEKYLPLSPEQQRAHELDDDDEVVVAGRVVPEETIEEVAPAAAPSTKPAPAPSPLLVAAQRSLEERGLKAKPKEPVTVAGVCEMPLEGDKFCALPNGHGGKCLPSGA